MNVTRVGDGFYRVDDGARAWMVAIAGPPENRWLWIDGEVMRIEPPASGRARGRASRDELSAPMPATVVKIMVEIGTHVSRGDALVMLEAMKMELPVRAPRDGVVKSIDCRPGELVQPGAHLVELE
jgi:biotin carboxyl carrier protein